MSSSIIISFLSISYYIYYFITRKKSVITLNIKIYLRRRLIGDFSCREPFLLQRLISYAPRTNGEASLPSPCVITALDSRYKTGLTPYPYVALLKLA